ncbi:MAG: hypothetical protein AAFX44_13375 [Pseudomonadota bacterium]
MSFEFYLWLLVQGGVLAALLAVNRVSFKSGARLFSPISWFVLFYALAFWLPQVFLPAFDFTMIGAYNVVENQQVARAVATQHALIAFLVPVALGFALTGRRTPATLALRQLRGRELRVGVVLGVIGLGAVGAMLVSLDPNSMRSILVASTPGKILYALSFWLTLGYMITAAWLIRKRRYTLLLIVTGLFAVALLPLGGRGRILWPIAGLVAWASVSGYARIRLWKLLTAAVVLGVVLQSLDPILLYYKGYDTADQAIDRFLTGLDLQTFLFARNFDSLHNLAVIVVEDRVPTSFWYLLNNSQAAFMNAYFPSVAWNGVGYPATLPGGLWLSGRWVTLIGGGVFFGLFLGLLSRAYRRINSELGLIAYCIAMPWLCHVGISYLDSYVKMAALILPGVTLAWLLGSRRRNPSPVLRSA